MQAVVKTPHIDINIRGEIPSKLLKLIQNEYGDSVYIIKDKNDELVEIFASEWYKDTKSKMTPGAYLKIYRENHHLTQTELGSKLGNIPPQHISNMENNKRNISLNTAKKLAQFFKVPIARFL